VVVAPGDPKEAQELTSQCFYLSQKYKIPCIILSDKHLAESFYTLNQEPKIKDSEIQTRLKRYNSYEKDEKGNATENSEIIKKNIEERQRKTKEIVSEDFETYQIYGNKDSDNIIVGWGSVKGAVLDAIKDLDVCFLQILYLEPFAKVKNELKEKNIILVENNSTGMLADILSEKTRVLISEENKILRYDGRPFLADELKEEIQRRLR
jgi:2-oxoglutarate ferredoxin oxidoreductase subunit alpha